MRTFRIDTHVHTAETSPCGNVGAARLVHLYKSSGYDGVIITDHYYDAFFEALGRNTWESKIDTFLTGYKKAMAEGMKVGFHVLPGMEIRFTENFNDYLVFGIDENFLKENKELYRLGLKKFKSLAEQNGLLVFQAHPFRSGIIPAHPSLLDGVEIFNGNMRHNSHDAKALAFARENSLMMSSGSDFHEVEDLARGGMELIQPLVTSTDFTDILKHGYVSCLLQPQ